MAGLTLIAGSADKLLMSADLAAPFHSLSAFVALSDVASTTFFLLLVISFVDVAGGFAVGRRAAQRDISFQGVENAHSR